ncbi:MAG: ABC transporter ATP-binding protein [Oscillospiraceae bacterium]|jgi:ABC-2 type transport system ATP-binding protein|nr:ABC transporter ATP-binding protein [Oscillospiraceae bacterium]
MITTKSLTKSFDGFTALENFSVEVPSGSIYGLVGTNGSGKSTLLRLISGIYRPDGGSVEIAGETPYENVAVKKKIFHVSDDLYFLPQTTMDDMAAFYAGVYESFDLESYKEMCGRFPIDPKKRIGKFSKGMKRQTALILALACRPQVLLLDEAFDGLDPVIRIGLRKILADLIADGHMSVVIASHNLRELEDLCDHMGLLHAGRVIFAREIDQVKLGFCKVQAAFSKLPSPELLLGLDIMQKELVGSVMNLIVRGHPNDIMGVVQTLDPLFVETVPLTLEEVFIHEMEAVGYDYNKILF